MSTAQLGPLAQSLSAVSVQVLGRDMVIQGWTSGGFASKITSGAFSNIISLFL